METRTEERCNRNRVSPQQVSAFRARKHRIPANCVVIPGCDLVAEDLATAIARLAQSHEILRAKLTEEGDLAITVTDQADIAVLDQLELNSDEDSALQSTAASLIAELDPASGRNLGAQPIHGQDGEAVLLAASAEILDAVSLCRLATALQTDNALPQSDVDFFEYSEWRAQLLADPKNAVVRDSWAIPAEIRSPVPLSSRPEVPAREAPVDVPQDLPGEVKAATLVTLWALYLAQITGTKEITLGVSFDGRIAPAAATTLGPFEQILSTKFTIPPEQELAAYLSDATARLADCRDDQDVAPVVFSADLFASCVRTRQSSGADGVEIVARSGAHAAVELWLEEGENPASAAISVDGNRYGDADAQRFAAGFAALLQTATDSQQVQCGSLPAIGADEQGRLAAWGAGPEFAQQLDIVAAIADQAKQFPDKAAATDDRETVDYGTLCKRASAVAARLKDRGDLQPGAVIPVIGPPSVDLVAMILGVIWAGFAFAPMDPAHPAKRHARLVESLQARLVLTTSSDLADRFPGVDIITPADCAPVDDMIDPVEPAGESLAYVIFTSGSSGTPKGVRVTRAGLANYLGWAAGQYDLGTGSALAFNSPAFDLSLTALLGPLVAGGHVLLPGNRDAMLFAAETLSSSTSLTMLKCTPSLLRSLLAGAEVSRADVACVVLGGEPMFGRDVHFLRKHMPDAHIFNEYGPTETVVGSVFYDATGWRGAASDPVPIGRPISNTQVMVASADGHLQPFGAPGELLIAGAGVADGYHDLPDETHDRFVESALGRAYRTGDRVFFGSDGELVMIGRTDSELSLNGIRCHPAEIEAALESVAGIDQAVVRVRSETGRSDRLVAFVKARADAPDDATILREASELLPQALVPTSIVHVENFPTTASGKLDREALESSFRPSSETTYERPRGNLEEVLAVIIGSVLGVDQVGRNDDYFALGGDSLRSVQVSALASKRGIDLSVAQLHRSPVLHELAAALREGDSLLDASPRSLPFSLVSAEDRARMPAEVEDAYPLNLLQEGMIYHRDFAPKSAVYHAICSYRIRARLDVPLMQQVIHDLIVRHPLLRTSFDLSTYSVPLQVVHTDFVDPVTVVDLSDASEAAFRSAVDGWMEHEKATGFDVDGHPLIRYAIHVSSGDYFQLSYSFHHEIIDGWSDAFMVTELLRDYFSRLNGEEFRPQTPQATFRDAIAQEQLALANPAFKEFWMGEFEDAHLMRLPRLAAPHRADKGERQIVKFEIPIDHETSDALKELARSLAVPVKTLLLAVHMRTMSVIGGSRDTTSYTVGNGRPENAEGHAVIGLFVNSLAFRLQLPAGASWRELVRSALAQEQKVLPYRRYPMAELKRQAGNEPLSETLFFFNHYHVADALDGRPDAQLLDVQVYGESTFPYCVNAYISPVDKKIGMRVEYDQLQFTPKLLATMEKIYLNVIEAMLADIDAPYDVHSLLPGHEAATVTQWGQSTASEASECSILPAIGRAAKQNPDRTAVVHEGAHLTYGALDRLSGQIAAYLGEQGVGVGAKVAIVLPRSVFLPAVILGVMKAGAAYIPLDSDAPDTRTASAIADIEPALVIGNPASFADAIAIDELISRSSGLVATGTPEVAGECPAYVIFTSGSTGKPKGVVVSHQALARSTAARLEFYEHGIENFLLLSNIAFDSSVAGLFATLANGGTLVLPNGCEGLDLVDLGKAVSCHRITHTLTVPSLYSAILRETRNGAQTPLRSVIVAGEEVSPDLVNCHLETLPSVQLVNEYGPTEATVWASAWIASGSVTGSVPMGKPVAGTTFSVLDGFGFKTPTGVVGEAHLSGPLLADGYVNRPRETALAFCPANDPERAGQRAYATGDLVHWDTEGRLHFAGRRDNQTKIDGFRIETGEVEAALLGHPDVRACVVLPRSDHTGKARLVAYVVPHTAATLEDGQLDTYLRGILPRFMLPRHIEQIDALPLAAGGKVDRKALPDPVAQPNTQGTPPRTATEEALAGIWSMVLGPEQIGVDQRFFGLGGDSLRAMRVAAATEKLFGIHIHPSVMISEDCNIAELAERVESAMAEREAAVEVEAPEDDNLVRI